MKPKDSVKSTPDTDFVILSKVDYFNEIIQRINGLRPGDEVSFSAMIFHPNEPNIRSLVDVLCGAASRGVRVTFTVDAFSFLIRYGMQPGPLFFHRVLPMRLPKVFEERRKALQEITSAGGSVAIINMPDRAFRNPYTGRSHIKYAVINDIIYAGGCNLDSVNHIDYMVRHQDRAIASWLHQSTKALCESGSVIEAYGLKDIVRKIDARSDLVLDVGLQEQSAIYERALRLIDTASESIIITCQVFPFGKTARHLANARARGVHVKIIFNHPAKREHGRLAGLMHRYVLAKEKKNLPKDFFRYMLPKKHKFLHAKMLITDQGSMIGSHNFLYTGVGLGTAEIAIYSTNPSFSRFAREALLEISDNS